MEEYEVGDLDWYSADISYFRARERARNHHADDDSRYSLLDLDALDGIDNEQYLFQVIDEISAARQEYAHDLQAYGDMEVGQHENLAVDEVAGYGLDICLMI